MRRTLGIVVATLTAAIGLTAGAVGAASSADAVPGAHGQRVCTDAKAGEANCFAEARRRERRGRCLAERRDAARRRQDARLCIRDAYKLTGLSSGGRTVAIVDAYGYPNAERDLGTYRSNFGLSACTTANGCLRIMDQNGGTNLPRVQPRLGPGAGPRPRRRVGHLSGLQDPPRPGEVSASIADLGTAVEHGREAVRASSRSPTRTAAATSRTPPTAPTTTTRASPSPRPPVTTATRAASFPASSAYVTAVGGTSLTKATGTTRGWTESVWSGAGSGCSTYNVALAAAATFGTGCAQAGHGRRLGGRRPADRPARSTRRRRRTSSSWAQYGGTSLSSPIIAAVYALSGNTSGYANAKPYANASSLFDVTSGSNGSCPTTQWCKARTGWDGPTGLGTPNGVGAF